MRNFLFILVLIFYFLSAQAQYPSQPVTVQNFPGSQPVTGTVTVNQGTNPWTTSRNWSLSSLTDSVIASLSGTGTVNQGTSPWVTSRNWVLSSGTDSMNVGNFPSSFGVTQSTSPWVTSRNWSLSSLTDSVIASLSGTGTVVTTGGATISKDSSLTTINTTLGSPFQAGGSIGNSSFNGTLLDTTQTSSITTSPATIDFTCSNLNAMRFQVITTASPISCNSYGKTLSSDTAISVFYWDEVQLFSNGQITSAGFYDVSCAGYSTFELQCTGASVAHPINVEFRSNPSASGNSNLMGGFLNTVAEIQTIDALPLPSGAATSALQTTGNTSLTTIISSLGSVPVTQKTSPWLTSRNWTLSSLTDSVVASLSGTATMNQGTSPWVVGQSSGSNLHVNVDSAPSTAVTQGTSPWVTSRNWSLSSLTDSVVASLSGTGTVNQGTSPWVVSGSGNFSVTQNTSPWVTKDQATQTNGAAATTLSHVVGGVFNTSPATISNGQIGSFQLDSTQNLLARINASLPAGTSVVGAVNQGGSAPTTSAWPVNIASFGSTALSTGTGAGGAGIPRVTISNDSSLAANQSVNTAQVNGVTTSTGTGASSTGSQRVVIASDSSISLGQNTGKANVFRTGGLTTTATTVNQVINTYTVTSGKIFYLEYLEMESRANATSAVAAILGVASLESPANTTIASSTFSNTTVSDIQRVIYTFPEPIPILGGAVIRTVTTPSSATATYWITNFGGYEK